MLMRKLRKWIGAALFCGLAFATGSAAAVEIDLTLVASYARQGPFGLAFDGTYIYWSQSNRQIHQMTTSGVDTASNWTGPVWSELAYDSVSGKLASAQNQTIYYYDVLGGNQTTQTLTSAMTGITNLQDGFDIDSGEIWISPDIGNVYRYTQSTGVFSGTNPFLGGGGGYSGVERVDVGGSTFIIVVNDALNPRRLCVHGLDAALIGCENFSNQRYEGLAFDGRYLWAADYVGNKIDKFDVLADGGSIFVPPGNNAPEPASLALLGVALAGLGVSRRRKLH